MPRPAPAARPDRVQDLLVAGAAAQVAGQRLADLGVGRRRLAGRAGRAPRRSGRACRSHTGPRRPRRTPRCTGSSRPPAASPSTVTTSRPSAWPAATRQAQTGSAVEVDRARAALALLAGVLRAGQAEPLAQHVEQALARPHVVGLRGLPVDRAGAPSSAAPLQAQVQRVRRASTASACRRYAAVPRTSSIGAAAAATSSPKRSHQSPAPARPRVPRQRAGGERLRAAAPAAGSARPSRCRCRPRGVPGRSASANEQTAITIALRVPTLANCCGPAAGRHAGPRAISSSGASDAALRAGEEVVDRRPGGCRAPRRARPRAPAASSGGCASPAGEAEPRLPPTVPRLRICGEPTVREAMARPGQPVAQLVDDPAVGDARRRSAAAPPSDAHSVSSATRVRSSSAGGAAPVEVQLDHHVGAAGDRHRVRVLGLGGQRLGPGGRAPGSPWRSPGQAGRRRVVAEHRALDQPVRPVGRRRRPRSGCPARTATGRPGSGACSAATAGPRPPPGAAPAPGGPSRTGSAAATGCTCRRTRRPARPGRRRTTSAQSRRPRTRAATARRPRWPGSGRVVSGSVVYAVLDEPAELRAGGVEQHQVGRARRPPTTASPSYGHGRGAGLAAGAGEGVRAQPLPAVLLDVRPGPGGSVGWESTKCRASRSPNSSISADAVLAGERVHRVLLRVGGQHVRRCRRSGAAPARSPRERDADVQVAQLVLPVRRRGRRATSRVSALPYWLVAERRSPSSAPSVGRCSRTGSAAAARGRCRVGSVTWKTTVTSGKKPPAPR